MSTAKEFRTFWEGMREEQKRMEEEQMKQDKEFDAIMSDVLKALMLQQEEDPVIKTLDEVFARAEAFRKKSMSITITASEIKALEEANPEFMLATQTGFSEEEIKQYTIDVFDSLFGAINIGKLENTLFNVMRSVLFKKRIDFSQFNGIGAYNYISSKAFYSKYLDPEYKKKVIYNRAVGIVVEAKTISFNTAVKRAIREIEEEGFVLKKDAEHQEFLDDISAIINPLIDLYIENEVDILSAIGSKVKKFKN